jgi:hypothetical protein
MLITLNRLVSRIITFGTDQISFSQQTTSIVASKRRCMGRLWYIESGRNTSWRSSWITCHQNPTIYQFQMKLKILIMIRWKFSIFDSTSKGYFNWIVLSFFFVINIFYQRHQLEFLNQHKDLTNSRHWSCTPYRIQTLFKAKSSNQS